MFRSGVAPASQTKKSQFMNFSQGAFRNKSSICESCLFSQGKNTRIHKNGMNFSFWLFLSFGLQGRLLIRTLPREHPILKILQRATFFRYRPKGVFGKGVGNSQKCVRNASEMRQNGSCFIGKRGTSKMRQKSVKIASEMRQKCAEHLWGRTPFGRYRFLRGVNSLQPQQHAT